MSYLSGKLAQLTDELFAVSQRGELGWREGDSADSFVTQVRDLRVSIEKLVGTDNLPAIAIALWNHENKLVQRYTDADLSEHSPENEDYRTFWDLLNELHQIARWSSEGIFEIIDDLLEGLAPLSSQTMAIESPTAEREADEYEWSGRAISPRIQKASVAQTGRRSAA